MLPGEQEIDTVRALKNIRTRDITTVDPTSTGYWMKPLRCAKNDDDVRCGRSVRRGANSLVLKCGGVPPRDGIAVATNDYNWREMGLPVM